MALQTSGAISLGDLQTEFGGSNPIGMSEYYRGGAYVPTTTTITGTASNVSYTRSLNGTTGYDGGGVFWRYYENGNGILPTQINNSSWFYAHRFWTDQAWTTGTGWCDSTFTLDQAGTYIVKEIGYHTGATRSTQVYVNGVLKSTFGNRGSYTFTTTGPATIRIYATMTTYGNYNAHEIRVIGNNGDNRIISASVNGSVPSSGQTSLSNFYGATTQQFKSVLQGDGSVYVQAVGGTSGASGPDIYYSGQSAKVFRLRRSGNSFFLDWTYNELDYANVGSGSLDVSSVFPLDGDGNLDTSNTQTLVQNNVVASNGADVRQIGAGSKMIGSVRYWWFGTDCKNFGGISSDVTRYDAYVDVALTTSNDVTDVISEGY